MPSLLPPPVNHRAADLEAAREPRNLRPGERPHSFVMADNPYVPKPHRAALKARRLEEIQRRAKAPATLSGKHRRRAVKCVGAPGEEGVGDISCVDGTLRRSGSDALRGLRRVVVDQVDMVAIVPVTEPKLREPQPPCHPDGKPKQPEEMEPDEKQRYERALDHYKREGIARVECIIRNAELDSEALKPKGDDHDFDKPGEAARRYGRQAYPTVCR